jgi:hypothetical protein
VRIQDHSRHDDSPRYIYIGSHAYDWEDAGMDRERFDTFVLNFGPKPVPAESTGNEPKDVF